MKKGFAVAAAMLLAAGSLAGCQKKQVQPGDVAGFDPGEQYLLCGYIPLKTPRKGRRIVSL